MWYQISGHKFLIEINFTADKYIYFTYIPRLFSIMLFLSFAFQDYLHLKLDQLIKFGKVQIGSRVKCRNWFHKLSIWRIKLRITANVNLLWLLFVNIHQDCEWIVKSNNCGGQNTLL